MRARKLPKKIKQKVSSNWRLFLEDYLSPSGFFIRNKGYCPCCDMEVIFRSNNPWLRDHYVCTHCKCIPRERALMRIIEQRFSNWRDLYIHESSPVRRGASLKLKKNCQFYLASQYYPGEPLGKMAGDFINQDLGNQTFENETFDLVITQDVMEHVFHPEKVFAEIARTLKKGGAHIFTVPLVNRHKPSEKRVKKKETGEVEFLYEPEYHGNPVDKKGSLVTMNWGYDIVDFIKIASDMQSEIIYQNELNYGIWAEYIEVVISYK